MRRLRVTARTACLAACLLPGTTALAADPCQDYKWNVSSEVRLFASKPTTLDIAAVVEKAPTISTGILYLLELQPQEVIRYPVSPSKKTLPDGFFGGLVKFQVRRAGTYRIAIDAGFWIDVVREDKSLPALDFNGKRACSGPRKIVAYELPAGAELVLQIAQSNSSKALLTITSVVASGQ